MLDGYLQMETVLDCTYYGGSIPRYTTYRVWFFFFLVVVGSWE